jgi:hypothetical protein
MSSAKSFLSGEGRKPGCAENREGVDLQQVKILPGNWVAPAGSYRSGGGGNETVGAFETNVSPRAMQRADKEARTCIAIPNTGPSSGITNHDPDTASSDRPIPAAALAGGLLCLSFGPFGL